MATTQEWCLVALAPCDGRIIIGKYGDDEMDIRWNEQRSCMLGPRAGSMGAGWEDVYNNLPTDPPDTWRAKTATRAELPQSGEGDE